MRHCVSLCFYFTFVFLYNIVSGQLTLLLLINDDHDDDDDNLTFTILVQQYN